MPKPPRKPRRSKRRIDADVSRGHIRWVDYKSPQPITPITPAIAPKGAITSFSIVPYPEFKPPKHDAEKHSSSIFLMIERMRRELPDAAIVADAFEELCYGHGPPFRVAALTAAFVAQHWSRFDPTPPKRRSLADWTLDELVLVEAVNDALRIKPAFKLMNVTQGFLRNAAKRLGMRYGDRAPKLYGRDRGRGREEMLPKKAKERIRLLFGGDMTPLSEDVTKTVSALIASRLPSNK